MDIGYHGHVSQTEMSSATYSLRTWHGLGGKVAHLPEVVVAVEIAVTKTKESERRTRPVEEAPSRGTR